MPILFVTKKYPKVLGQQNSGLQWIAKDSVPVTPEVSEKLQELFAELDENDDVEDYFTNAA